jgi:hypothetical protein
VTEAASVITFEVREVRDEGLWGRRRLVDWML